MYYNGRYYTISEQRIPYMRDKTTDERFFILTLFGIAMEMETLESAQGNSALHVTLSMGLPPKHYGTLYKKFREYFIGIGKLEFTYREKDYVIQIDDVVAFP